MNEISARAQENFDINYLNAIWRLIVKKFQQIDWKTRKLNFQIFSFFFSENLEPASYIFGKKGKAILFEDHLITISCLDGWLGVSHAKSSRSCDLERLTEEKEFKKVFKFTLFSHFFFFSGSFAMRLHRLPNLAVEAAQKGKRDLWDPGGWNDSQLNFYRSAINLLAVGVIKLSPMVGSQSSSYMLHLPGWLGRDWDLSLVKGDPIDGTICCGQRISFSFGSDICVWVVGVLWRLLALWYCISLGAASWRTSVHYDNIFSLLVVVRWSMLVGNGSLGLLAVGSTLGRLRSCNLHSLWVSGAHAGSGENSVFDFGPLFGLVVVDRGWFPPPCIHGSLDGD